MILKLLILFVNRYGNFLTMNIIQLFDSLQNDYSWQHCPLLGSKSWYSLSSLSKRKPFPGHGTITIFSCGSQIVLNFVFLLKTEQFVDYERGWWLSHFISTGCLKKPFTSHFHWPSWAACVLAPCTCRDKTIGTLTPSSRGHQESARSISWALFSTHPPEKITYHNWGHVLAISGPFEIDYRVLQNIC